MNIYVLGISISFFLYIVISMQISKRVKNADDYYVAGRKAPVYLIAGSMIASYASTSMFMGDAAQCYEGAFSSLIILSTMQTAGYIIGGIFFGRYLRRSNVLTIPEFFGKRFNSNTIKKLASFTAIITMIVYLLSVTQGIGTLMSVVTGIEYNICIIVSLIVFTVVTIIGGAGGVLITDTLMAGLFTVALIFAAVAISNHSGGWYESIRELATNPQTSLMLSWGGKPGVLYDNGIMNVLWGMIYGIVWMSVCMVGPWQSSRYLMAKNESVVVKSSFISVIGIFLLELLTGMAAVMVNIKNPNLENSSHVLIWAAMNEMPKLLGVILLTGLLAAGISSATTFLSLIGASFANDILEKKGKGAINTGRITMISISAGILILAVLNPPAIFWITFFGGAIVASSWMPVAMASVFSKRVTKAGAFCGMLSGFAACFSVRLFSAIKQITLPVYLDPSVIGICINILIMIIVSSVTQVSKEEKTVRESLFVIPESEKNPTEIAKTLKWTKMSVGLGGVIVIVLLILWVIPYKIG